MRLISRIGGRHHNDSVVTCEISRDGQTLLTGCEDGFLRVFEVRTRQLVAAIEPWRLAGLEASHPPVSIALSSAANDTASSSDDPGGTTVFCAVGCKVVCMDLRALRGDGTGLAAEPRSDGAVPGPDAAETGGQEASQQLLQACLETNDDDINQIALSGDGHLLAAVDDSGQVALLDFASDDPEEDSDMDLVEGGHAAICSSVAFLPHRRNSFITGGLDHTVVQWQGWEVVGSWSMGQLPEVLSSATQLVNPPMVHALDTAPLPPQCGGAVAAAACGSGHVALLRLPWLEAEEEGEAAALTHPTAVNGVAHSRGASAVRFLSGTGGGGPGWLVSGGNDRQLVLWDVRGVAEQQGSWPETAQRCTLAASVAHGSKANYLAAAAGSSRVYVAATSKHVGEYLLD